MEAPVKGDIVVVPFPFSDLSLSKKRPALVLQTLKGDDVILCQITSTTIMDDDAISLTSEDFIAGQLKIDSNIRPDKIFTADAHIILYKAGTINQDKITAVVNKVIEIMQR